MGSAVGKSAARIVAEPFDAPVAHPHLTDCNTRGGEQMLGSPARRSKHVASHRPPMSEEQEEAAPNRLDAVMRALTEGMIVTDADGRVREMNPAAERLSGWRRAEALGRSYHEVLRLSAMGPGSDAPLALGPAREASAPTDWMLIARDNRRLLIRLRVVQIPGKDGPDGAAMAFTDVTEESLLAQDRTMRSTHDALTGLLNRDEFVRRVRQACERVPAPGLEHVVAILDVDQFHTVNDTLGHAAGDRMLRGLAADFRGRLRGTDLLARLSGDEFGVLLLDCAAGEGDAILEALLDTARRHQFSWDGHAVTTTVSIGAARVNGEAAHEAGVLSLVDAACFAAKEAGRDCVRYFDADHALTHQSDHMSIAAHLSAALDENRFVLCYQSVAPLDSPKDFVYRELLLRLRQQRGELIMPHRFIPAAEHYFLMNAIDRWVVHATLRHIAARPYDAVVSAINVSGQSVADGSFLPFVMRAFESSGVDPARVCFEISENVAVTRLTEVAHFMQRLAPVGCRFAIDHFGAGMASFGYIKNLPVHFIKIEGGLVRAMLHSRMDHSLVEAICRVGREMGVVTIAEHVERVALIQPLREIGVELGQGLAISPVELFDDGAARGSPAP
ncbi:MAG TPA: EAL domain-containing protein [Solimonas sp.]|nr:EAL domain-containing protein [Solimonas sp.]